MLPNTFIHIPGIGTKTENNLWKLGIRSWDDALGGAQSRLNSMTEGLHERLREYIPKSLEAIKAGNAWFFERLAKKGESWRMFPEFADKCVYLDIETTGLSPVFDTVTLVGLYDGRDYRVFIEGHNLEEFMEHLSRYQIVVTFNGSLFDLRFLKIAFPDLSLPPIHIDLRFVTRRLGLRGGLKIVERSLGIRRDAKVERLTGYDATVLWSRYLHGDNNALDLLIEYNKEDVVHLRKICEIAYDGLVKLTAPFARGSGSLRSTRHELPMTLDFASGLSARTTPPQRTVRDLLQKIRLVGKEPRIVGIDLTGSRRPSGWALLEGEQVRTKRLQADEDILQETIAADPALVSIDSPLSLPAKNKSSRKKGAIYRQCELALRKMGISVFWCLLPSMRPLTFRGIRLAKQLRSRGIKVIESYPGAAQDILSIPRKKASVEELKWGLNRAGIQGEFVNSKKSHDELDAITSALVGLFYLADEYIALGNAREDYLIVPKSARINEGKLRQILSMLKLD